MFIVERSRNNKHESAVGLFPVVERSRNERKFANRKSSIVNRKSSIVNCQLSIKEANETNNKTLTHQQMKPEA